VRRAAACTAPYDRVLDEPLPARLLPAGQCAALDRPRASWRRWPGIALGAVAGFVLRGETRPAPADKAGGGSLPRQAAVAHAVFVPEVRHPVEVGADQEAHLVGLAVQAPRRAAESRRKLDEAGYRLVGGRLLPGDSGEVAQFMYENAENNRLTLYVRRAAPNGGDTPSATRRKRHRRLLLDRQPLRLCALGQHRARGHAAPGHTGLSPVSEVDPADLSQAAQA
jgi:anti-sigma factor RsiW